MKKIVQLLLFVVLANNAYGQQDGLAFGSATLFPTVGLSFGHDDNVFFGNEDSQKLSSQYFVFSPGIRLEAEGEKLDLLAQYNYDMTSYREDSRFNFGLHHLLGSIGYQASHRSRIEVSAEYFDGSDRIGTGNQQGNFLELGLDPDEWHSSGISGKWHLGGVGSRGSVDLEIGASDREYDNNRDLTRLRDRGVQYLGLLYSHEVSPKTSFLAQFKTTNINYDEGLLDSNETRILLGAEWKATSKTSARALIGYLTKNMDNPVFDDFSGLTVEAGLSWSPRSYSVFDLTLNRETDETNGNGLYVVRNTMDLGWTHYWRDRFNTTVNVGKTSEDYKASVRDDSLDYVGLSAKYQFSKWLATGLGYKHYKRDSSINEFDYDGNSVLLTFEFSK